MNEKIKEWGFELVDQSQCEVTEEFMNDETV